MDINFDKIKSIAAIGITVFSTLISGFISAKTYLDSSFVSATEFDRIRTQVTLNFLDNRKYSLENRLFLLDICIKDPKCVHAGSANFEIEKTKREIDDTRGQIETLKRRLLSGG
jgi:hypothetical protein